MRSDAIPDTIEETPYETDAAALLAEQAAAAIAHETESPAEGEGADEHDDRPIMVDVDHVSMSFNMASEQLNSLKEYFIKIFKHELFFKEFVALSDISFTVREGDVFGIVGTNGSGKSTMLKIVAGVLEPSKGSCTINGRIAPLIELGAGFDLELTARENIYLNGALLGYSKNYIAKHFDEIVEFAELRDFLDLPMKNYSSGMVARIAFAIATIIVPDILIVDEALSVGDVFFQEKCERRIKSLIKDHGTTVLFVSHSIEQVERLCQRAIWIEKGHKVMEGDVHEVCAAYRSMGYIDYACGNGIMERSYGESFDIRDDATCGEMRDVLNRIGFGSASDVAGTQLATAADNDPLVRQDAARLLYRLIEMRRPSLTKEGHAELGAFYDEEDIAPESREAVAWCVGQGMMAGGVSDDGKRIIEPTAPLSRIGLAKMITVLFRQVIPYPDDVSPTSSIARGGDYDFVTERDIMHGYASGLFGPRDSMTRSHAVMVIWGCAGKPKAESLYDFPDVPDDAYYRPQASWAVGSGYLKPLAKGLLGPEDPITPAAFDDFVAAFCAANGIATPTRPETASGAATPIASAVENASETELDKAKSDRPTVGRSTRDDAVAVSTDTVSRAQVLVVAAQIARALEAKRA